VRPIIAGGTDDRPGRGFTLIELLVVIAIVSLLVSILLPSLERAKAAAKTALCASRLHGIGCAYGIYVAEYGRGCIGYSFGSESIHPPGWSLPSPNPYRRWNGWYNGDTVDANDGHCHALGKYLPPVSKTDMSRNPTHCPNHPTGDGMGYAVNKYLGVETFLGDHVKVPSSTPMLADGSHFCSYLEAPLPEGSVRFTYLIFPGDFCNWVRNSNEIRFAGQASWNHTDRANFLFFDGHVETQPSPPTPDFRDLNAVLEFCQIYLDLWTWYGE
jgi:prepilin-type N-terminal cleavage/methylation domain-containing protein/prepilin-type processing-associated H-X9-DG protein